MYKLERVCKCKIVLGILTLIFFILPLIAAACHVDQRTFDIILIASPLIAVVCLLGTCLAHALEKDIAEWLGILENRINDKKS